MKKILVVFTGGTIGSVAANGTITTSQNAPFKLLELFRQHYHTPSAIHFDTLEPLQILSENLNPAAWKIIINAIEAAQPGQYDGIIVTHGTDTLAYTAAALSLYFNDLAKPVLLVSSDYPLDNPKANGLANFICAVEFIRQKIAMGVFVPYRNSGQTMQVHYGTRLGCSLQLSGDFFSVQNQSYTEFAGQHFKHNKASAAAKQKLLKPVSLQPEFANNLLLIKPYPGLDYSHFNLNNVKAILHDLYHSGTACATLQWGNPHSLIEFLKRCRQQHIPVYLAPAIHSDNAYQSTRELIAEGAQMIWNTSIETAYVKLLLAYGNFADAALRQEFLANNIANEHI